VQSWYFYNQSKPRERYPIHQNGYVKAYWEYITPLLDLAYGKKKIKSPKADKTE
jgi:hypothetical protein